MKKHSIFLLVLGQTNNEKQMKEYQVRKNNVISYKGNFYTLPQGTYRGPQTKVLVMVEGDTIYIFDIAGNQVCSHKLSLEKGKTVSNTHHRRDNSQKLAALFEQVANCFTDKEKAKGYLLEIKKQWPRYSRDHFLADKTLGFCCENDIFHGSEFEQVMFVLMDDKPKEQIKPMGPSGTGKTFIAVEQGYRADVLQILE